MNEVKKLRDLDEFINEEFSKDMESIDEMIDNFEDDINEDAKEEYEKYFAAKMKEFGIESPADLKSDEEKKRFFNALKSGWGKESGAPKNESITVEMVDEFKLDLLNLKLSINEDAKEEYQKYFDAKMKEFGIESPADLKSDEEKKRFFNALKDGWSKDDGAPKE